MQGVLSEGSMRNQKLSKIKHDNQAFPVRFFVRQEKAYFSILIFHAVLSMGSIFAVRTTT